MPSIDEGDIEGKKRREAKILALVRTISPDCYDMRIPIGWWRANDNTRRYVYIATQDVLEERVE